jgi:hypothetical protein
MKKIVLIFIMNAFLVCTLYAYPGKSKYRIVTEKEQKTNVNYAINDFYSVYYVYMNVIKALDIDSRLSDGDIEDIMVTMIDRLKKQNVVQLQVDDYPGAGPLRVTLRKDIAPKTDEPILWIISNYNAQTKKVVAGNEEEDAYGTFFYIIGDKLVKYQYVHKPKKNSELKKMTVNSLADYYLLDSKADNDGKGKQLLKDEIKRSNKPSDKAVLYMTLSEYYLIEGDIKGARDCLASSRKSMDAVGNKKKRGNLYKILPYAEGMVDYFARYTER